jgi:hypothetical protein
MVNLATATGKATHDTEASGSNRLSAELSRNSVLEQMMCDLPLRLRKV